MQVRVQGSNNPYIDTDKVTTRILQLGSTQARLSLCLITVDAY